MRNGGLAIFEALTSTELSHIIPVIEEGLALTELQYRATREEHLRERITNTCILVSFLRFRKLLLETGG